MTLPSHQGQSECRTGAAPLRYLSVCSGIEAATVAWHPLGWQPAAFAEIEKFPSAVLAHHYPHVPNLGDMTKFGEWPDDLRPDVLVGGTPCQSFSVAGLRKGMADPRGNLALTYLAIADRYRPEWLLWENVPGVLSSNGGRDFGSFLGGMGELGYGFAYRVLDAQYVRVDGFGRAVPQRRRRVFVVGNSRDWRRAAAVLFERESLSWDTAPRRKAGKGTAADIAPSIVSSGRGTERAGDTRGQDPVVAVPAISHCLNAGGMGRQDYETETETETVIATRGAGFSASGDGYWRDGVGPLRARAQDSHENVVAHALRAEGFDASEDGTGRGTPLVPVSFAIQAGALRENPASGPDGVGIQADHAYTLEARPEVQAIAFDCKASGQSGFGVGEIASTMRAMGHANTHQNGGGHQAVAFDMRGREGGAQFEGPHDTANIRAASGGSSRSYVADWAVRRLTPRECERLQAFNDDYTLIDYYPTSKRKLEEDYIKYLMRSGTLTREQCFRKAADGPRYKALGNSMAVNAMRWLGTRIQMVAEMSAQPTTAISSNPRSTAKE
jgi:DNA (cytosine-5)-methyltransferase 1